jgi:hypothetical protein
MRDEGRKTESGNLKAELLAAAGVFGLRLPRLEYLTARNPAGIGC